MMILLQGFLEALPFLGIGSVLLFLFYKINDWITPFKDLEEIQSGNQAAAISVGAAYIGAGLSMLGSLIYSTESYWVDVMIFVIDGVLIIAVFSLSVYCFDWVILRKVNNLQEIKGGNKAVAFVEGCAKIALGLILCAAFSGGDTTFWTGIASAGTFSIIGTLTLLLVYFGYDQLATKGILDLKLKQKNMAAAYDAGTLLFAAGICLWFSISGDFMGWLIGITTYLMATILSIGILLALRIAAIRLNSIEDAYEYEGTNAPARAILIGCLTIIISTTINVITYRILL
jgi:uncharacterized membrane protein YjfL (UPF0719 family)